MTIAGRRPKRLERYEGGEKARYYKDDDVDLQTLVKRTKYEASAAASVMDRHEVEPLVLV